MNCNGCRSAHIGAPFDPTKNITVEVDGDTSTFAFLVVACDPQDGLTDQVMKNTAIEEKIFSKDVMHSFYFQTTLMKFPKVNSPYDPVEIFNPINLNKSEGLLHSYRSETRKEVYELTAASKSSDPKTFYANKLNQISHEYVTLYQLVDPSKAPPNTPTSKEALWAKLQEEMTNEENKLWFPYDASRGTLVKQFNTKYFNHFTMEALKNKPNNWNILKNQGQNNTVYVHASTAFESVLDIYSYIEILADVCPHSFPSDKASKIAVVGAGPSGLLISLKLSQMGYTDITVLESKQNHSGPDELYAGKTQTNIISQSRLNNRIPCELGTCYLSPAYQKMYKDFDKFGLLGSDGDKNDLISLDQIENGPVVKDIITQGQFLRDGPVMTLFQTFPDTLGLGSTFPARMDFEKYQTIKGFEEHYQGKGYSAQKLRRKYAGFLERVIGSAAIRYITYHRENFGKQKPFATKQSGIKNEVFSMNIYQFLKKKKMLCLLGLLQFGYSLQGYGSTAVDGNISAFYLLVWVTPDIFMTFIHNQLKQIIENELKRIHINPAWSKPDVPVVAALSKGWGDVWVNMKKKFAKEGKVAISYGVDISKITRSGV